ncbi:MAG TPA: hypothetical protein VIK95_03110 [Egibacteraceae bacterium]
MTVLGISAETVARLIAIARIGLGVAATLAPRLVARALMDDRDGSAAVAARMLGGRDLALGLGAVLAARRGPAALRGWVEAGALADGVDAAAFAVSRRQRGLTRLATVVVAGGAAAAGMLAARRLGGDSGQRV